MPMKYCINELEYIKENISKGVRPDLRKFNEIRNTQIKQVKNTQADGSVEIKHGYSHIRISIQFKEEKEDNIVDSNYIIPSVYMNDLKENLKKFSIGLNINMEVLNDDGNILNLFIKGLNKIFENIEIPNINNLEESLFVSFDMPEMSTFGIFENLFVRDPLKLEEESCDSLLTIFHKQNEICSIFMSKSGNLQKNIMNEIIKSHF
jgi:exosome complex component RRP43